MKNISFDNPYLLLIGIPLLLAVIVPYIWSIRKDNVSKSVVTSLILHIVMVLCITFAVAGTTYTTVVTETNVYVVADVSYSTSQELDKVDEHIRSVQKNLPNNAKMGVVCFGRNQQEFVKMGGELKSVQSSTVDVSATNIAEALHYTTSLFEENVIKRIVLITDGSDTCSKNHEGVLAAIESLRAKNVYLDAIYVDTNLEETTHEVQISEVDFTAYTYEAHKTTANVLMQSNRATTAIVKLYKEDDEEAYASKAVTFSKGYNVVHFDLDTTQAGTFTYEVKVEAAGDVTLENNVYTFTQQVEETIEVLLVSEKQTDYDLVQKTYGMRANVDAPLVADETGKIRQIPFSIEQLCKYDEIIISDFDVRKMSNRTAFLESLDQAVSVFGKSLITMGNTEIQNMTEEDVALGNLANMLPVKYGNASRDAKLLTIVLDISRSMSYSYKYQLVQAKKAAKALIELLNPEDMVLLLPFSGSVDNDQVKFLPASSQELIDDIDGFEVKQSTMMGAAIANAYDKMADKDYAEKQIFVISDGLTAQTEVESGIKYQVSKDVYEYYTFNEFALKMKAEGISTSSIYVYRPGYTDANANKVNEEAIARLKELAKNGGGKYYMIDSNNTEQILLNDVAETLTESVVERLSEVEIADGQENADVLKGLTSLPAVSKYVNSKAKGSAITVLETAYTSPTGTTKDVPIYAYWTYGNGQVASFTSSMSGEWIAAWADDTRSETFFTNVFKTNVPQEKRSNPYVLEIASSGLETEIEITPAQLHYDAVVEITIINPNAAETTRVLSFDSQKYTYTFETEQLGRYELRVTYTYEDWTYTSTSYFEIPYEKEYDRFIVKDIGNLTDVVRNRGTVHTNGDFEMLNDESGVSTYKVSFTLWLLIATVALFVVDIVIRKMKIEDFKMLFKRRSKGGK